MLPRTVGGETDRKLKIYVQYMYTKCVKQDGKTLSHIFSFHKPSRSVITLSTLLDKPLFSLM